MSRQEQISQYLNDDKEIIYKKVSVCPFCHSEKIIKKGLRITDKRGNIQRYLCKDCKKKFTLDSGFYRMRFIDRMITCVLNLYYNGMSLRKIKSHLEVYYDCICSHMTILRWIRKYISKISKFVDNLKINNSDCITFDEVEYKTKKEQSFFIGVMDKDSRFIVSSDYSLDRSLETFVKVLAKAKRNSKNETLNFNTDGLLVYKRALRKIYHYKSHSKKFNHKIIKSSDKEFNWIIERFNNTLRERTKTMRQFKSLWSAKLIMKGFEIFYNFCRKHTGINKYPYENVTDLKLGKNKWLDLINLSAIN